MSFLTGFQNLFKGNKKLDANNHLSKVGEPMSEAAIEASNEAGNVSEIKEPIKERIVKYLNENDWCSFQIKEHYISTRVEGRPGNSYSFYIFIDEERSRLTGITTMENRIIEKSRSAIAELTTRINYARTVGNFELDMDDGEVRYKTYIDLLNSIDFLTDDVICDFIWYNVNSMDFHHIAIMQINYAIDNNINVKEFLDKFYNEDKND
jgi:hypothetical protein